MKKTLMYIVSLLLAMLIALPVGGFAQDQDRLQKFSQAELDQMLAPIALYPDSLLAQVLMASTYPLEVVMADRWVKAHPNLSGDQLQAELDNQNWDPSVKALVPFPQVLAMMGEKLEWTERLGDAFLDQQEEVMDAVQKLREKAREAGNLKSSKEQRVVLKERIIVIEPANPEIVYVPVYNPTIVYGRWWYPAYPPFWYYPPGYVVTRVVFAFPFFFVVGPAWPVLWGHWDWPHHTVYVNVDRTININRTYVSHVDVRTTTWHHDADHRRGVPYRSEATRERYTPTRRAVDTRPDVRGFNQGVKTAPKISSKPPITQQPRQTSASVNMKMNSNKNKVGSLPTSTTQQQQRSDSTKTLPTRVNNAPATVQQPRPSVVSVNKKPDGKRVTSMPATVQGPQSSAGAADKRPEGNKVSSVQTPMSQPKVSRGADSKPPANSGNKGNAVFGGMARGSEVKKQSEQSIQSRRSVITGGGSSGSPQVGRMSSGSPAAGGNPGNVSVKGGFGGGSGQGGVAIQKNQGRGNEKIAEAMPGNDHNQPRQKMK
jgi:hypothetical protein